MVVRFHTLRMPIDRIWLTLIYWLAFLVARAVPLRIVRSGFGEGVG